jgi:Ca2+-binding RTX toxin-like protein
MSVKIDGGNGNDALTGGNGNDLIDSGESGNDVLAGGLGSDGLIANAQSDRLAGGPGPDLLVTSNACGGHLFDGGPGEDNVSFARDPGPGVKARLGGVATGRWVSGGCLPSRVLSTNESLEGSMGADILIGNSKSNRIMGQLGWDTLMSKGGKDLIIASDDEVDESINCGAGRGDRARVDSEDPRARNCR